MEVGIGSRLIADLVAQKYGSYLPQYATGKLLDLGCGKVPLLAAYEKYVSNCTCVDWGQSLHKNQHLDQEVDLNGHLPFCDETYDTIILSDVLEHIAKPDFLWSEMSRILACGGKIILNVPFYYWLHECPHDYYRYTEFALRRFVENSGLKVISIEPIGGAPEIMVDIFAKNMLRVPLFGKPAAMIAQFGVAKLRAIKDYLRSPSSSQYSFPFGYFLIAEKLNNREP
jgi:SAM-dependent methyltransferase